MDELEGGTAGGVKTSDRVGKAAGAWVIKRGTRRLSLNISDNGTYSGQQRLGLPSEFLFLVSDGPAIPEKYLPKGEKSE